MFSSNLFCLKKFSKIYNCKCFHRICFVFRWWYWSAPWRATARLSWGSSRGPSGASGLQRPSSSWGQLCKLQSQYSTGGYWPFNFYLQTFFDFKSKLQSWNFIVSYNTYSNDLFGFNYNLQITTTCKLQIKNWCCNSKSQLRNDRVQLREDLQSFQSYNKN